MNIFRILGDVSHTTSKCILIYAIHSNKSAEGVSLITQLLYGLVFVTRYLDLFWVPPYLSWWNFILKNFYIWSSIYIVYVMLRRFARTREREKAWRLATYILVFAAVIGPLSSIIYVSWYRGKSEHFTEILWAFSIVLESVCVVPQLLLLRQTTVPTVIDSYYLVTLGSYRGFYILNWIERAAQKDWPDAVSVLFGIIQTALYVDFAWVYYTRQRVKLRGGSVVDADDLSKGFLVNRFAHVRTADQDEEEVEHPEEEQRPRVNNWGKRGVSIRADDTLDAHDRNNPWSGSSNNPESEPLTDPDHFLSDDEHDDAPVIDTSDLDRK